MEKRVQKARRLLNVMTKMHRIEEQKKLELQRRYAELERSQEEVIQSMNAEDAFHGMFIGNTTRLLRSLSAEAQRVADEADAQSIRLRDRAVKIKTAERLKETLEKHTAQIRKETELRDIIERYVGGRRASLP